MKVVIEKNGLLVVPETDFEEEYLRTFHDQSKLTAFLKHGATLQDLVGLKIEKKE
jgi:hypothetical protein